MLLIRLRESQRRKQRLDLLKAESEIQVDDLRRRALHRFVEEETRYQSNIENTILKAIPQLDDEADPSQVEDDWITNFFDKCRIVSDDEMQTLWSRVLAGEANAPGAFSKRTVNILFDLEKHDAELLTNLCGFGWKINEILTPLIFDVEGDIYNIKEINFSTLSHLESIGLIRFTGLTQFTKQHVPKGLRVSYFGQALDLEFEKEKDNYLDVGKVFLSVAGDELAQICGSKPVEGFVDYVREQWKNHLPENST